MCLLCVSQHGFLTKRSAYEYSLLGRKAPPRHLGLSRANDMIGAIDGLCTEDLEAAGVSLLQWCEKNPSRSGLRVEQLPHIKASQPYLSV